MVTKFLKVLKPAWASINDRFLGIKTGFAEQSFLQPFNKAKHQDSRSYQAVDYWNIRRVLGAMALSGSDIFYDIGCGKGRVVCCAARGRVKRVVGGIDLNPLLCEIARKNAKSLRGRESPIEICCEDASVADVSDGTAYFMFNPFGEATMREFLKNIERSLITNPRAVRLAYCNPVFSDLLDSMAWLARRCELKNLTGGRATIWRSRAEKI